MKAINTLRIAKDNVFMGPGPKMLLEKIAETLSLRKASMETGISYTKALRLLRALEAELGFAVVESQKGGKDKGGTRLTEKGCLLLEAYTALETDVQQYAQQKTDEMLSFLL